MPRVRHGLLILAACAVAGCGRSEGGPRAQGSPALGTQIDPSGAAVQARQAALDRDFPLHGLVTGEQPTVHVAPDANSRALGWLRIGGRIRLKPNPTPGPSCRTGWYAIAPRGYACAGEGISVGPTPPPAEVDMAPHLDGRALPYDYYLVKEDGVAEYHRPPSRDDQRQAAAFGARYAELREEDPEDAEKLLAGELENEPPRPAVVNRLLDRGFFVAAAGVEVRAFRQFARNSRGRYLKLSQLEPRTGMSYAGVELTAERGLPMAFAVREGRPLRQEIRRSGAVRWVEDETAQPIERLSVIDRWRSRERIGTEYFHVLEGERYLRDWYVTLAERGPRPRRVPTQVPWVHVDLSAQTLVVYRGDVSIFATLVSTGLPEHATPTGIFRIRRKYIAATMANIGADAADDRYRIEDVPWTQYFEGSVALHGTFWHGRFGQTRSHGCVNVPPAAARRIFELTFPQLPDGWFGISAEDTGIPTSYVVVTE